VVEQWERVQRYYKRFQYIDKGMPKTKDDAHTFNFQDEAYAFFIFCYHLMDWIDKDKTIKLPKRVSAQGIHQSE